MKLALLAIVALCCITASQGAGIAARLSAAGSGLRIEVNDHPGTTLVAVHYNINQPLSGVKAGRYNYDIRAKSGGKWVHTNTRLNLKNGDRVYYWIYQLVGGRGYQITNQNWVVSGATGGGTSQPVNPVKPQPPVSTGGRGGDETWKGRRLRLVLNDNFDGKLDTSKWNHAVTLSGGGNWEFQAYTNLPDNSFTRGGALFIKPTLTADKYGQSFLTSGNWDMARYYGKCTDSRAWGCKREGQNGVLNPVLSAKLESKASIKYGKVEISAKMPRGDWLWPALWMLPDHGNRLGTGVYGGWPKSGEIDIMESRGNRNYGSLGVEYMGTTLHWGTEHVNRYGMTSKHKKVSKGTLADGYHKYTFYWDENEMIFTLDGEHVATFATPGQGFFRWGNLPGANIWSSGRNAPFNQKFYLIMNIAVGGTNGFFPDNVPNGSGRKPWSNQDSNGPLKFWQGKNQWYPTWQGDDAAMQIDYVRMWQLE